MQTALSLDCELLVVVVTVDDEADVVDVVDELVLVLAVEVWLEAVVDDWTDVEAIDVVEAVEEPVEVETEVGLAVKEAEESV